MSDTARVPTAAETLAFAHRLIDNGVPVVVCKPRPGGDDVVPVVSWRNIDSADQCRPMLDHFEYGTDALALVGGYGIDLIDVDAKAGGTIEPFGDFASYGVTRTPSGGWHYVVSSTGLRRVQNLEVDGRHVGDYVGGTAGHEGRMLGFLPGSARPKYGDRLYAVEVEWDVESAVRGEPDPGVAEAVGGALPDEPASADFVDDSPPRDPADGVHPYADKAIREELARLDDLNSREWAPGSYWDDTTFEVACGLLRWANSRWTGYSEADALADLLAHAPRDDRWGRAEHLAKWRSAKDQVGATGRMHPDDPRNDFDVEPPEDGSPAEPRGRFAFRAGGSFVLDTSPDAVPVWGTGGEVLMAEGEALIVAAGQGLGKTTIAQQFVLRRCGLVADDLLGHPVLPGGGSVLYLAMDRPKQAARSLRRMVSEAMRAELDRRLVVWEGPPPADMASDTGLLAAMCADAGADTVVVDSLKDAALNLSEDGPGAAWNRSRQTALQAGVQVFELHHNRKKQQGARGAPGIDDIYGSTWITSGAGSVVLLTGQPGDAIVGLHHVKQPADPVGPLQVVHDHDAGATTVYHSADLVTLARATRGGITALQAAEALFETGSPTPNEKKRAERKLAKLERPGSWPSRRRATSPPGPRPGGARTCCDGLPAGLPAAGAGGDCPAAARAARAVLGGTTRGTTRTTRARHYPPPPPFRRGRGGVALLGGTSTQPAAAPAPMTPGAASRGGEPRRPGRRGAPRAGGRNVP